MADFEKIGLLSLNESADRFLVCAKAPDNVTGDLIMPGGQFEEDLDENEIACLQREIGEELDCKVDESNVEYVGEYIEIASGFDDKTVRIRLYKGKLLGTPRPASEVKELAYIGKTDQDNEKVSPIIRNKIIPDLVEKGMLR